MECDRNCHNCPFQVDPYDPNRHVCIRCGREYSFQRVHFGNIIVPILLTIFIVALVDRPSSEFSPPSQSSQEVQAR